LFINILVLRIKIKDKNGAYNSHSIQDLLEVSITSETVLPRARSWSLLQFEITSGFSYGRTAKPAKPHLRIRLVRT